MVTYLLTRVRPWDPTRRRCNRRVGRAAGRPAEPVPVHHRAALFGALVVIAAASSAACAADRIYWTDSAGDSVSFANLDGSGGGGDLNTAGATSQSNSGVAIDVAAERVYWANSTAISFANLDGTGGADLKPAGATVSGAWGIALDPAAGRVYWANNSGNKISLFSGVNGAGGSDLNTTGVTVSNPIGVAIDLAGGRIYFGNATTRISFARLDGTGGADLNTTGATVNNPQGLAIDPAGGRVYWANYTGNTLSFAALDGTGGGDLTVIGATVSGPQGVAIDPDAGRIYWGNYNGVKISVANLDGTGGADLDTTGATLNEPGHPALLQAPRGSGVPAVTGGGEPPSVLSCSPGSWAGDLLGSFLYRAPARVTYQWSLNGTDVAGATGDSHTAYVAGEYRCTVTASNFAGATSQTSAPHIVVAPLTECVVPDVVGRTLAEATAALEASGCTSGKVKRVAAGRRRRGRVVRHRPKAGERLPLGGKVNLRVGRGRSR